MDSSDRGIQESCIVGPGDIIHPDAGPTPSGEAHEAMITDPFGGADTAPFEQGAFSFVRPVDAPEYKDHDISMLDLAFVMDCTASMGGYIKQAQQNIRFIAETLSAKDECDLHLALIEYRDHPPQDHTFVTRPHDFTPSVDTMRTWLNACSARGGGDTPEAVADAWHELRNLSWRDNATKICVHVADAPPHGLLTSGDSLANGCPLGYDPMEIWEELSSRGVTLYMVGCEPSINSSRLFYEGVAYSTGGQFIPLKKAAQLTQVIIGAGEEEMSLEAQMESVQLEVDRKRQVWEEEDRAAGRECGAVQEMYREKEVTKSVHDLMKSKGVKLKQLTRNNNEHGRVSEKAKILSKKKNMAEIRSDYCPPPAPSRVSYAVESDSDRGCKEMAFCDDDDPILDEFYGRSKSSKTISKRVSNPGGAVHEMCYVDDDDPILKDFHGSKSAKSVPSPSPASKTSGFASNITSWFGSRWGGGKSGDMTGEVKECCVVDSGEECYWGPVGGEDVDVVADGASMRKVGGGAAVADTGYTIKEEECNISQAERMVKKALNRKK